MLGVESSFEFIKRNEARTFKTQSHRLSNSKFKSWVVGAFYRVVIERQCAYYAIAVLPPIELM